MSHTCHSRVFSLVTRLLALLESIAEAPHRQVAKRANRPFLIVSFSQATTILTEAITVTMIHTRRFGHCTHTRKNSTFSAVIYYCSQVNTCCFTPFSFKTINNVTGSSTEHAFGSLKPILLVMSACQDLECASS